MKYPSGPQGASSAGNRPAGRSLLFAALASCTLPGCTPPHNPPEEVPQDLAPAWSPDGARLALQREGPDATPGVYLLQIGAPERQLVLPGATSPDWSPDGSKLVAQAGAQIVQLDLALGNRSRPAHGLGGKAHDWGHCATPYFPSIIMLPSMSLSERLGPKLSSRLLVSTRRPLLAPSVTLPTRWV
jgi:hypothetical protein